MASMKMEARSMLLLLQLATVLYCFTTNRSVIAQRTYMRSCDCEPTPDGKCAYTLMLPMSEKESCSTDPNEIPADIPRQLTKRLETLDRRVQDLGLNLSQVTEWTAEQSRMLTQLQSKIIEYSGLLLGSEEGSNASCTECGEIVELLNRQNETIVGMKGKLDSLGNNVSDIQTLQEYFKRKVDDNINQMTDMLDNFSNQLQEAQVDITSAYSEIRGLNQEYFLCKRKGLLVSGAAMITEEGEGGGGYVDDAAISASSQRFGSEAVKSRIRTEGDASTGAWCAEEDETSSSYEWLQFDLGAPKMIYGLVTRGRSDYSQWVESYKLQYSNKWTGDEGWATFKDVIGFHMVFDGNRDMNSPVTHMLWQPIRAQYIRFVPITAYDNGNRCMRADVIGCLDQD